VARSLLAFRLTLPIGLKTEDVARWLTLVNGSTHATRFPLIPSPPVALEVVATRSGTAHFVLVPRTMRSGFLAGVRAALPGAHIDDVPDYFTLRTRWPRRPVLRCSLRSSPWQRPMSSWCSGSSPAVALIDDDLLNVATCRIPTESTHFQVPATCSSRQQSAAVVH
jgi:hypothetical protein